MNITVLAVGKIKERYLQEGIAEYLKRLRAYAKVSMIEVPDEKAPDTLSAAEEVQIKEKEGQRLLEKLPPQAMVVGLAIQGRQMDSEQLARQMPEWAFRGQSHLCFLIGGSLGLSEQVLRRSHLQLSFSRMTFPHQLMRLILLEQLCRAFRIQREGTTH